MIVTDIDNTICETTATIWRRTETDLGLPPGSVPLPDAYDDHGSAFPDPAAAARLIRRRYGGLCTDTLLACAVVPGARDVLISLHRHGLFSGYVTRRPHSEAHVTQTWLRAQGLPDAPVVHASGNKADAMQTLGAHAIIEDAPHEAASISLTHRVALIRRPYNAHLTGPNIIPFRTWKHLPIRDLLEGA